LHVTISLRPRRRSGYRCSVQRIFGIIAVLLAGAATAHADDSAQLAAALQARATTSTQLAAMLADTVAVGPLLFYDAACLKSFGGPVNVSGDDRARLADCLAKAHLQSEVAISPYTWSAFSALFVFTFEQHKISSIGPYPGTKLPTLHDLPIPALSRAFTPSSGVIAAIDRTADRAVFALFLSCSDGKSPVTTRLIGSSGIAAYDKEAVAFAAKATVPPEEFSFNQHRVAACLAWPLPHSNRRIKDIVQPVKIEKQEDGVEGGVEGGLDDADAPPPPPPPPPPAAPPQNVAPQVLEALRIAGTKLIEPDDATKKQIAASGRTRVVASFKLCVTSAGDIAAVTLLKSSGFASYDLTLQAGMRDWKYKPYFVNGRAVPVCTAVTFIYSL
jgi:hypothetical protein